MVSVIIPARNEIYLQRTIENVLANAEGEIEVIAELDGYVPAPQIDMKDNRVIFVYHKEGIGQRACINHGAKIAKGEFIMKLDAHCAVDKGFDVKLAADCEYNWTVIPRMYNLDYVTWKPKLHKMTDYMYIGCDEGRLLRAEYYGSSQTRNDKLIDDTMCCMGPCFFMRKDRFWELEGCDEKHEGGWGQQGVEIACKAWLSGGSLKVNKKTWFAHWFRGGGGPGFPYKISGHTIEKVRRYSRDLWVNDKWEKQTRKFQWLIEKFDPPGWDKSLTILYYTANKVAKGIEYSVIRSLKKFGYPIISISQEPMDLGKNIVVPKEQSLKNIYKQVLIGAKAATTEYVALCEDDCLYTKEHFKYRPKAPFAYNLNRWLLHLDWEKPMFSYRRRAILSQCIANREALIKCLEEERAEPDREMGIRDGHPYETFETKEPNLVICHSNNTSGRKTMGKDAEPCTELPPWGTVDYWVRKFEARKNW
jgi:glycosyltransferase involved in cell wall biosynthesis